MKKLLLAIGLTFLVSAAIAQQTPADDDPVAAAQARMEANSRAHQAAASQSSTNPTTKKSEDLHPDFAKLLSAMPPEIQPNPTGWDDASIKKAGVWIRQHLIGKQIRQQATMISRTTVKVAAKDNPSSILHWELVMVFKPDTITLNGIENKITLKTTQTDLTVFGKKIVEDMLKEKPDQALIIFVVDNKMSHEADGWKEGDPITYDAVIDQVAITKGEAPDKGTITVSLTRCHPLPSMAK